MLCFLIYRSCGKSRVCILLQEHLRMQGVHQQVGPRARLLSKMQVPCGQQGNY